MLKGISYHLLKNTLYNIYKDLYSISFKESAPSKTFPTLKNASLINAPYSA